MIAVLRKLNKMFERPVLAGVQEIYVTFSTGIALYPHDGEQLDDLLRHADTAMYQAKSSGSSQYRFYAPDMNARGHEFLALEADLRRALERNEFILHYQPQVDMRSGGTAGVEGLIRWQHPTRGLVCPVDFIPLLENSGLTRRSANGYCAKPVNCTVIYAGPDFKIAEFPSMSPPFSSMTKI